MLQRRLLWVLTGLAIRMVGFAQSPSLAAAVPIADSLPAPIDSTLRITNLSPWFTLDADSLLSYPFQLNRMGGSWFWFLRNQPLGLNVDKNNGLLTFRPDKSFFHSGRLKYDFPYRVDLGVRNAANAKEAVDTSFTIIFFTTEIVPSHLRPSGGSELHIEEGDTVSFRMDCDTGNFPITGIQMVSSLPIRAEHAVRTCGDEFSWSPPFDFVTGPDTSHEKLLLLTFTGTEKFFFHDTTVVKIFVKNALDYTRALAEYNQAVKNMSVYVLQLKYAFVQADKKIKRSGGTRTGFDLGTASTALGGTVLSSSAGADAQRAGRILPSAGIALVPVKEAVAPQATAEQNAASLLRASIKRMQYMLTDNRLSTGKDMDILKKTAKLRDELKQVQVQLIEVPVDEKSNMSEEDLNDYFNNPKVNRKYRLK